jgi:methionyl-tRNA formyltransferase
MKDKKDFKIVFMGTPEFAVASLDSIRKAGFNIVGVITAPDRPAGRGQKIRQSAVKTYAVDHNLNVLQPDNLKDETFQQELSALQADLFVVVAFRMLPEAVWMMPKKGTINLHGSLLPQYRGAAPINWAIINGERETGVTTFFIDTKIDTGDIIEQRRVSIDKNMTAGDLHDKMMVVGAELLTETIESIQNDRVKSQPQSITSKYKIAPKIFRTDCRVDISKSIEDVHNQIRGLSPYPAAWLQLEHSDGQQKSLKIFQSEVIDNRFALSASPRLEQEDDKLFLVTGNGALNLSEVQLEGKKKMNATTFLKGFKTEDWKILID